MTDKTRPYLFYDVAVSVCSTCYRKVEAKVVFEQGNVLMLKRCPEHGAERVLVADDVDYYRRCREVFIKPPEMPLAYNTPTRWGCPYDCGLCTDHEQHSCLTLVEVTDACNLRCPVCYAGSGPERQSYRSLEHVEAMLDAVVRNEGEPDVVQISGGEPTLHPRFFDILDAAKRRPIKHLMVNTNGVRIAQDEAFVRRLAGYMPGFEVYLQFDSLEEGPLRELRGADLREVRRKALENLNRHGISTNLVVVVKKGLNDGELGRILDFALQQPCVRGVTFQPIQDAGRLESYDPARDRLTLTEVRRRILEQSAIFAPEDLIPVPCHPDALAMAYALKVPAAVPGEPPMVVPLTGLVDPKVLIEGRRNTIVYEKDDEVKRAIFDLFSTSHSPESGVSTLKELLCCLPQAQVPEGLGYQNLFRLIIMQFIDAHAFDVRSVKKACVTIVHPDGRLIPFDTYNMFYRDGLETQRLEPLRRMEEAGGRAPGRLPMAVAR
jgi:7,8-dihydro-6-hydroxymethylpterin dimethyltransferase